MRKLLILGAGGQGKVVADIARLSGYDQIAFLDDNQDLSTWAGYPVLGAMAQATEYPDWEYFIAIGNSNLRQKLQMQLVQAGKPMATLIHPGAVIAQDAVIGEGSVVMAGAVINPNVVIGQGCIINTCASVDHDCVVGDFCHISVGSHLAGTVQMGSHNFLGIGAVVSNNLSICDGCTFGAGAVVVKDITAPGTYVGVPAKKL